MPARFNKIADPSSPGTLKDGRRFIVGMAIDITERKEAEEHIVDYQTNLEKLVEERTKQLKDSERLATIGATAGMVWLLRSWAT